MFILADDVVERAAFADLDARRGGAALWRLAQVAMRSAHPREAPRT